jgi:tetratricopeptide (TPR) repeat protein
MALTPEKRREVVNNNLGLALAQDGRYDEAIVFYKEKNEVFADDKRLSASILSQLGYVYQQSGHLDEAIETYKKSWELASSIGDTHSAQAVLSNIICLCQSKALYSDALNYAQESIKIASQAASEKDMAANLLTIGSLYTNLGLEDVAKNI